MYFWNMKALKKEIVEGQFTDQRVIPYVVVSAAISAIAVELSSYFSYEVTNQSVYYQSAITVIIPILGTIYTYHANGGANGKNFAAKYFAIGFVILFRFLSI